MTRALLLACVVSVGALAGAVVYATHWVDSAHKQWYTAQPHSLAGPTVITVAPRG